MPADGAGAPVTAPVAGPVAAPLATPGPARPPTEAHVVAPATPVVEWEPFGYLRLQYIAVQDDPNVSFVGRDDGFELQNARLGFRGKTGRVGFVVSIDGAVDERDKLNDPQGKLRVGLRDAYGDVHGGRASTLVVRAGRFTTWVDPEAQIADTSRALVDRPLESRGMRATEGYQAAGLTPGRSLGVALRADPGPVDAGAKLGFEIAAQNGADEFASNNDNNALALSAAGILRFPHDGFVVAAGRWNPRTIGNLPFRQDETDLQGTVGAHALLGAVAVDAGGVVQRTSFETTGGPVQNAFGAHAQLLLNTPLGSDLPLAWGYRFGILDPSSLILTDRVMEHSLAAVLAVPSWRVRVQLQLTHVVEQSGRELSNDRAQLAVEAQL